MRKKKLPDRSPFSGLNSAFDEIAAHTQSKNKSVKKSESIKMPSKSQPSDVQTKVVESIKAVSKTSPIEPEDSISERKSLMQVQNIDVLERLLKSKMSLVEIKIVILLYCSKDANKQDVSASVIQRSLEPPVGSSRTYKAINLLVEEGYISKDPVTKKISLLV